MAMTKKEQAEFKAAIDRAELLAALRWTSLVEKDVPPPQNRMDGYSEGWDFNSSNQTVRLCWSSCIYHGEGPAPKIGERYKSASQNPMWLFSTKEKALAAMRHEIEKKAATDLLAVDRQIERVKGAA
jgi:hypothetical protein